MTHANHVKAQALALLLVGESQRGVARTLGLPLTTVHRWRHTLLPLYAPKMERKKELLIGGQPYRFRFSNAAAGLSDAIDLESEHEHE